MAWRIAAAVRSSPQSPKSMSRPRFDCGYRSLTISSSSVPVRPSIHWAVSTSATGACSSRHASRFARASSADAVLTIR